MAIKTETQSLSEEKGDKRALHSLRSSAFLASLPLGMILFGLPLIAREMGASTLTISGLMAIYALIVVLMQPIVGSWMDRIGRRPFLIAGLLGYAASSAIYSLASGIEGLFLAQLAQGVGSGLLWLAAMAVISDLAQGDCLGREYGRLEEMAFRGILAGTVVGLSILGLVRSSFLGWGISILNAWRIVFFVFSIASLAAVYIVWRWIPESLGRDEGMVSPPDTERLTKPRAKWRFSRQLRFLLGIVLLTIGASELMSPIFIPYLFDNITTNVFLIALSFLPAALAGALLPSRLGGLSDKIGRRIPIIVALIISSLATLAIPFMRSLLPLAILTFFEAAAFAAATPAEEALVIDLSDEENEGLSLGMYTAAAGMGGVIGPLLGAWIYSHYYALGVFGISAFLLMTGAVLIFLFLKEPGKLIKA
jgi:MFS family permease